jgi:hypothetical protein
MANTDNYVFQNQAFTLTLDTGIDLSAETGNVQLLIRKPDDTETTVTPTIVSPATGGILSYTFAVDELDQIGDWEIKSYLVSQQTPGQTYYLTILERWEDGSGVPTALEIREYLEGFCLTEDVVSNRFISRLRDEFILPWIEAKIGQPLGSTSQVTQILSGSGSQILALPDRPIVSLDELSYINVQPGAQTITISSVEVIAEEGLLRAKANFNEGSDLNPLFRRGNRNIRAVYTIGYSEIPLLLRTAIKALTAEKILANLEGRTGGGNSFSVQGWTRSYGDMGKYGNIRKDLARTGLVAMRSYLTASRGSV